MILWRSQLSSTLLYRLTVCCGRYKVDIIACDLSKRLLLYESPSFQHHFSKFMFSAVIGPRLVSMFTIKALYYGPQLVIWALAMVFLFVWFVLWLTVSIVSSQPLLLSIINSPCGFCSASARLIYYDTEERYRDFWFRVKTWCIQSMGVIAISLLLRGGASEMTTSVFQKILIRTRCYEKLHFEWLNDHYNDRQGGGWSCGSSKATAQKGRGGFHTFICMQ